MKTRTWQGLDGIRLGLLLIGLAGTGEARAGEGPGTTPRACTLGKLPVLISLLRHGSENPGGSLTVDGSVQAACDVGDVEIGFQLPPDVMVPGGSPLWRGTLAAGEIRAISVTLTVPTSGRTLKLYARSRSPGSQLVAQKSMRIGPPGSQLRYSPPVQVDSQGTRFLALPTRPRAP